jgi:photosystem II stability/assembly factor-like uncharacterized protein
LILKSTDGGATWANPATIPVDQTWLSLAFFVGLTGFASGTNGTIIKTTDGGATWSVKTTGTAGDLWTVFFTSPDTGYSAGSAGSIIMTKDGGETWEPIVSGVSSTLRDLNFLGGDTGYAVGGPYLVRTANRGSNWVSRFFGTGVDMMSLASAGGDSLFALSADGAVYLTTDAGITWDSLSTRLAGRFFQMRFANSRIGYAVGELGAIHKTVDGGSNWISVHGIARADFEDAKRAYQKTRITLNAVQFANADVGWAVGDSGRIIKTVDGGANWVSQASHHTLRMYGLHVFDSNTAIAFGDQDVLLKTVDGGAHWVSKEMGGLERSFRNAFFLDGMNGYLVGLGSTILKTSDAGETWTIKADGSHGLYDVAFKDSLTGLAIGSWTIPNSPRGAGLVLKTTDGGETWLHANTLATAPSQIPRSVSFTVGDTCYVTTTRGEIYESVNAGTTWRLVHSGTPGDIVSIQCFGNPFCYAVATNGTLLKTSNGETWSTMVSGAGALRSFHFPDPGTGYAVGLNGLIIKITNPDPTHIAIRAKGQSAPSQAYLRGNSLRFDLPKASKVRVRVFDARGRMKMPVLEEFRGAGLHSLPIPGLKPAPLLFIELLSGEGGKTDRQIIPWF